MQATVNILGVIAVLLGVLLITGGFLSLLAAANSDDWAAAQRANIRGKWAIVGGMALIGVGVLACRA